MAFKVKLIKSIAGASERHRATALGLGLRKMGDEKVIKDTPPNRGLAFHVKHLITVEEVAGEAPAPARRKPRKIRVRDEARARAASKA